jgi:hypothetical protein
VSLTSKLETLREAALLDIDKLDDEVLISKNAAHLAEQVASAHYVEQPRVRRAVITSPRPARLQLPGDPGKEHDLLVTAATSVELWVLLDGFDTLALLAKDEELELGDARVDPEQECVSVAYVAEHPNADVANAFFQKSLDDVERRIAEISEAVQAHNDKLLPFLTDAVETARSRAKERARFAAALTLPQLREPAESVLS